MRTTDISTKESDIEVFYGMYRFTDDPPRKEAYTSVKYLYTDLTDIRRYYISLGFHLEEFSRCEYYHDFGFVTLNEFCEKNLGLDKSAVSRCINVYRAFNASSSPSYVNGLKKFGSPMELSEDWDEYSYSQLCEMLPLTPEQRKDISPDMSVKQIREYKKGLKYKKSDNAVATSQQEKFDYDKYLIKNGIVLQNYIKNLIPYKCSVPVYIYDRDGKRLSLGKVIDVLEFGSKGLFIRLQYNDDEIGEAIKNA